MNNVKKAFLIVMLFSLLLPLNTLAKDRNYVAMNFEETLAEENLELIDSDYQETDDQITIYMFRGSNCNICRNFLSYLNSITETHGKYFKLVSFEVWSNQNNAILFEDVAEFFDMTATRVPFIVIGDRVFEGYDERFSSDITEAIVDLYNSEDRYDVFEELEKAEKEEYKKQFFESGVFYIICITNIVITFAIVVCFTLFVSIKNKHLMKKITELEEKVNSCNSFEVKEVKKEKSHKEHKKRNE